MTGQPPTTTDRFALTVRFQVEPDHHKSFLQAIRENAVLSVRNEPGCLQFDVLLPESLDDVILLYEIYTDKFAFDAHLASAHYRQFDDATRAMVRTKDVAFYRATTTGKP